MEFYKIIVWSNTVFDEGIKTRSHQFSAYMPDFILSRALIGQFEYDVVLGEFTCTWAFFIFLCICYFNKTIQKTVSHV